MATLPKLDPERLKANLKIAFDYMQSNSFDVVYLHLNIFKFSKDCESIQEGIYQQHLNGRYNDLFDTVEEAYRSELFIREICPKDLNPIYKGFWKWRFAWLKSTRIEIANGYFDKLINDYATVTIEMSQVPDRYK